jgi:hypothetical protein
VEYRLENPPEQAGSTYRLNWDTLGWVDIAGDVWTATYVPRAGVIRPALDVLRHYRDQINLRGGRRLLSIVGNDEAGRVNGGQMAAHFPGAPPLWLELRTDGEQIQLWVIVERSADPVRLTVPPERTPGQWHPDPIVGAEVAAPDRAAAGALLTSLSRFFRDAPLLKTPFGFDASLVLEPPREAETIGPRGTHSVEFKLWLPETFQPCDTCPPRHANEAGTSIQVRVNDLYRVLTAVVDDDQGRPLYEVDGELSRDTAITRLRGGSLVMVRPGAPPLWTPVTREEFLRARIKDIKARFSHADRDLAAGLKEQEAVLKELEKTDPATARQVRAQMAEALKQLPPAGDDNPAVAPLTQELASLSDTEKAEPAVGGGGHRIVRLNPSYANPAFPPAVPQVIVVEFDRSQSFYYRDIIERMKELDWAPVAALVR